MKIQEEHAQLLEFMMKLTINWLIQLSIEAYQNGGGKVTFPKRPDYIMKF